MPERAMPPRSSIPQDVMLSRLAQSEQMREFFIGMWLQNPSLAQRAGRRVQDILSPASRLPRPNAASMYGGNS